MRHERTIRQNLIEGWAIECFGFEEATSKPQRGLRLAEEAIEAAQASGTDKDQLHKLIDYIYDRPVGEPLQEAGGVAVTLLAYCAAHGIDADMAEHTEVKRILNKPREHFTKRNVLKNEAGFRAA